MIKNCGSFAAHILCYAALAGGDPRLLAIPAYFLRHSDGDVRQQAIEAIRVGLVDTLNDMDVVKELCFVLIFHGLNNEDERVRVRLSSSSSIDYVDTL
jgi:hypothetical protein